MSGTENTPKRSFNALKVEHAAANAVADHQIGPLESKSYSSETDFTSKNTWMFGTMDAAVTRADVVRNKDGSERVVVSVQQGGDLLDSSFENQATRTVNIDPAGRATLDPKKGVFDHGSSGVAKIADEMAQQIVKDVNGSAPVKMKAQFKGFKP